MNPWSGLRGLPRPIWVLFAAVVVNRAGTMALPFLVLYLTRHLGIPAGRAGLVLSVYGLAALATAPIAGRLSDALGTRRIMKLSLFVSGGLLFAFPFVRSFPGILVLTLLWSVTSEAFRPASLSAVAHLAGVGQRKAAFAVVRLAVNLGMSIGPAAGGFLVRLSYPAVFWVDGATSMLAALILALSPWSEKAEEGSSAASSRPKRALGDRRLLYFLAALLPVGMVFFQLHAAVPLFLVRDLRFPEYAYGFLLTLNTLMIVFLEVPLNLTMADWSHRRSLALGALLTGAGFGAMAFASGTLGVAATVVVWTFGEMILFPGSNAFVADLAPEERRGEYMGLYQTTFGLAFTLGPWLGALLLDRLGARALWSATFLCGILSAALMSRVQAPARRE